MTLKEYQRLSPGFLFFKKDRLWKGCEIYEVWFQSDYEAEQAAEASGKEIDRFGGGPAYILVDKEGSVKKAEFDEGWEIFAFLYPQPGGQP